MIFEYLIGLTLLVVIGFVIAGHKNSRAAAPIADPKPPVPVDPIVPPSPVDPKPPVPVDPPPPVDPVKPPEPVVPPFRLAKEDYKVYAGETRGSIEQSMAQGWTLPAGWDWADAFASGYVKDTASINMGGVVGGGHDRSSLYWPEPGASAIWDIKGHPGDLLVSSFAVPAGWKGKLKIGAYGEHGFDPAYGGRIDDLTFTVRDGAGNVLDTNHGGLVPFEIPVSDETNLGTCTAEVVIGPVGGVGYVQLNIYPAK